MLETDMSWERPRYPEFVPYPLVTLRVSIEPLSLRDVDEFVRYRRDPKVARFQGWETTYSEDDAVRLIESHVGATIPAQGDWVQLAIHHRETGELLGDLGLHSVTESDSTFELGFTIAPEHQGLGYATEAASALIHHLFTEVGAAKIVATTDRRNGPSISVLVALGFSRDPSHSWIEDFKGEEVEMEYFEKF
jgi:RimJ/RimL family protein N-acetyltransferase